VSQTLGKSVIPRNCKEFDTGLSAFNYSIDNFDLNKNEGFLNYAEKNIKKWIYNYYFQSFKTSKKQTSTYYNRDEIHNPYDTVEDFEEIALFKENLWKFGITLKGLSLNTPKKPQIIRSCLHAAKEISINDDLFEKLNTFKKIPIENLNSELKYYKQAIRKNKDYIIALSFLMRSNLEIIKSYLKSKEMQWKLFNNIGIVLETSNNEAVVFTDKCRFIVCKNVRRLKVGHEIKSNTLAKSAATPSFIRYFSYAAAVVAILVGAFITMNYIDFNNLTGSDSTQKKHALINSSPDAGKSSDNNKDKNIPAKKKDTPSNKKASPVKDSPENKKTSPSVSKKPAAINASKPTIVIQQNTPFIPAAIPSNKETPTPASVSTPVPSVKWRVYPESLSYPTVKATGAPGVPRLSSDSYEVSLEEDYSITMHMYKGNNGTMWRLYENNILIATLHREDNSPNDQMISRLITPKKAGTYTYKCELINDYGSTVSSSIEVVVKE
jgi:RNA polymerase sigma-I factor